MATLRIKPDTRQQQQLEDAEQTAWLDDQCNEPEDEYHSDPASLAERREELAGVNYFNRPIQ